MSVLNLNTVPYLRFNTHKCIDRHGQEMAPLAKQSQGSEVELHFFGVLSYNRGSVGQTLTMHTTITDSKH